MRIRGAARSDALEDGDRTPAGAGEIGPAWCRAVLNYVAPQSSAGDEVTPTTITIHDGRRCVLPGWSVCGFERMDHVSVVTDWDDDAHLAAVHYDEMADLARSLTGCDHALVSGHIRRNPEEAARHADLGPISFVHSDFAASYDPLIRATYREPREEHRQALARAGITAEVVAGARRLLILQFWRNTGPAKMDLPIAFCDARSVPSQDLRVIRVTDYAGGGFDFETLGVLAPTDPGRHRWYAFPELTQREIVAFRTYDSDMVARHESFWTPHSAFADPEIALGQPSRRSVELRATCLFL